MFPEYGHSLVFFTALFMFIENGMTFQFKDQCNSALGMENFKIPPEALHASRATSYWEPNNGRINDSVSGWCAGIASDKEWFQIKFDTDHYVTAVANQATHQGWVMEFTLAYSRGIGWFDYMENGTIKKFRRINPDYSGEIVISNLSFPVRANMIRIYPKRSIKSTCLRLEIYGCQACFDPFGVEDGFIQDKAMTASSYLGPGFEPFRGRLNGVSGNGSWCKAVNDQEPYLQIDLGNRFQVSMIAIQGNEIHEFVTVWKKRVNCSSPANETVTLNSPQAENTTLGNDTSAQNSSVLARNLTTANNTSENITLTNNTVNATVKKCFETKLLRRRAYVKMFVIEYSDNGTLWKQYHEGGQKKEFEGTTDANLTVVRRISNQLIARYIRIRSKKWKKENCLRVEMYGCKECSNDLGAGRGEIPNKAMIASTYLGPGYQPWLARLYNPHGAWCSATNDASQYLQVQFAQVRKIRQLSIQGSGSQKGWVSSYFIQYSQNGEIWKNYTKLGNLEILDGNFDEHEIVTRTFLHPFVAKFVRIRPVAWESAICLRIELFGCPACYDPLGMEAREIWDSEITASDNNYRFNPYKARLNYDGGWMVFNDFSKAHFIQVELGNRDFTLTGVATQGFNGHLVKTYSLSYSMDGIDWVEYREKGEVKIFEGNNPWTETVQHELEKEIIPAYIRLNVKKSTVGNAGLRLELYGCKRFDVSTENDALRRPTSQSGNLTDNSGLAVDGNRASDYSFGSCSLTDKTDNSWWLVDLRAIKTVTGVFIANRGDENYRNTTELSIRVGSTNHNGGVGNPTCGGQSHIFYRGTARLVPCVPEVEGRFVTIFTLEVNSTLSLCEVEVEVSDVVRHEGLGMYTELIPDERIIASSWLSSKHLPYYGRLDTNIGHGAWCAAATDVSPYLEIDLEMEHSISGIITQGKHKLSSDQLGDAWVTAFTLSFTSTREQWTNVTDVNTKQPVKFLGNDAVTLKRKTTLLGFTARVVRIHPKEWNNWPCLRVDLIGSKVCANPYLEPQKISNSAMMYSTSYSNVYGYYARLHHYRYWNAIHTDTLAVLKIDFGSAMVKITAIAVQSGSGYFVSAYELSYSVDGWSWRHWIEHGNEKIFSGFTNYNSINRFMLPYSVDVRYLIIRPRAYYLFRRVRLEVYGCEVTRDFLTVGIQNLAKIANSSMTASSWKPGYYPHAARLYHSIGSGSWCAARNKQEEYLEVDLGKELTVTKISLQGHPRDGSGVTSLAIAFSRNGGYWTDYKINGARKGFFGPRGNTVNRIVFEWKFIAKKIRIYVLGWYIWPCMRIELYHAGCANNLHFSLKQAKRGGYTASDYLGPGFEPWRASTLSSNKQYGWCADDSETQFLQIDLGSLHHVTGILTKGLTAGIVNENAWVEKYRIQYSTLGKNWIDHKEQEVNKTYDANTDAVFAKTQITSLHARFVRVVPTQWHYGICMKVELQGCKVCSAPLGMENKNNGEITDNEINTSPVLTGSHVNPRLRHSKPFISQYTWTPFIQVDLGPASKRLTAIAVQGHAYGRNTWTFYVKYMQDGSGWFNYTENGVTRIFEGGEYMDLIAKHYFNRNITTRFIRVMPLTWSYEAGIRIELYGCPVCEDALGIERGLFNVTASTYKGPGYEPWRGRLNHDAGIWRPLLNKIHEFLQVSFDHVMTITGIAIQGNDASCGRVKRFYLNYGLDGMRFENFVDPLLGEQLRGNENNDKTKYVKLGYAIRARHVRVRPSSYYKHMCMRIEIYGCSLSELPGHNPLGLEAGKIPNHSLKASSMLNEYHKPGYGRLNTVIEGGAWCARESNTSQYFQVDLIEIHKISNILLQGKNSGPAERQGWVTKFAVTYSNDGIVWSQHVEEGLTSFDGNNLENKTTDHELSPSVHARLVRLHAVEWHQLICMRVELIGCKACAEPLGLEYRHMHSDYLSGTSNKHRWYKIRLNNDQAWNSESRDPREYFQVVIKPYGKTVTALAIQGNSQWVTSFTLKTSEDGTEWHDYTVHGNIEVLAGCTTQYQTLRRPLPKKISSRYLRLHPRTWTSEGHISLELYGCDECAEPLGMVSGSIPNSNIKASSFKVGGEPWRARLGHGSGWIPSSWLSSEYLEVDLGEPKVITYIEIEGDYQTGHRLLSFLLDYRISSEEPWKNYHPRGSSEVISGLYMRNMIKKIATEQKLEARFIKIRVQSWYGGTSLKLEFYGCDKVCSDEVGIGSWVIKEPAFTASSYLSSRSYPWMARLRGRDSWCSGQNDTRPFLQVDIGRPYRLRLIATQGFFSESNNSAWVQQYTLDFRGENSSWIPYAENGATKVFTGNSDGTSIVKNQLRNVTNVRYIRFHPKKWHAHACARIELYGCKVFNEQSLTPLGMADHRIADSDILASDSFDSEMHGTYGPWLARLNSYSGCWSFPLAAAFLLVDLGEGLVSVAGVATQGCDNEVYVSYGYVLEYLLSFSDDGTGWYYYLEDRSPKVFSGNTYKEQNLPVRHVFIRPFYTRYVKFHVTRWATRLDSLALRVEIYGRRIVNKLLVAANTSFRASSSRYPMTPQDSILSGNKTWCAEFDDDMQYLVIDLMRNSYVTEIITQGAVDQEAWVETYTVSYGHSGDVWKRYKENGTLKVFQGNNDSTSIVTRTFVKQVLARFIRIHPVSWIGHICMRVDIRSMGRSTPLGIQKQKITDSSLTASSHAGPGNEPWRARLDVGFQSEAWRAGEDNSEQYLQIDLGISHNITHVATQGSHVMNESCWVTQFNLSYSLDGSSWELYLENEAVKVFPGNNDDYGIVKHEMGHEIKARYVRFLPVTWFTHVCMKVELYGYQVCGLPLGVNNGELSDEAFTASSYNATAKPWSARLNRLIGDGAWCAENNLTGEYLQIDLGEKKMVTGISTQGKHGKDEKWVTEYAMSWAHGSNPLLPYTVDENITVFTGNADQFTAMTHKLDPSAARYIKFDVKSWHEGICMRVEVLGCDVDIVNGGYTEWSAWSACSTSCAGGLQYRERICENPAKQNGGENCLSLGPNREEKICNTHLCPALSITAPSIISTNTPVVIRVDNCTGSVMRLDFGDCNVTNTSLCVIEHTYNTTGSLELLLQVQNHSFTRHFILVQDPVTGFEVNDTFKAVTLGDSYCINWKIDSGTMVRIFVDYGDNSTQTSLFSYVRGTLQGNYSHIYRGPGVFDVIIMAANEINNVTVFKSVVVEIPVNVSCLLVKNCGPFELIYQSDEIKITLELWNGSNPELLFITGEDSNFTQRNTELSFKFQKSGVKSISVFVYNNISTVQVRKNVYIHEILPLGNVTLEILAANLTEPTQMILNVTEGFPYLCFWDLGDGNSIETSSFQNISSVYHVYETVDVFNVLVNCSNNFGYEIPRAVATVQQPIKNLSFTNNCPRPVDESVIFTISTEDKGTNSCYIVDLGDGTVLGFGHVDCAFERPSVQFRSLVENYFSIVYNYSSLGRYDVSLEAWNLVSRFVLQGIALVVKIPCNFPTVTVPEFEKDINSRTTLTSSQAIYFLAQIEIDCRATNQKDITWSVAQVSLSGDELANYIDLNPDNKKLEKLAIQENTLAYGVYVIRCNVSMRGQYDVYSVVEGYIEMLGNSLIASIEGGSLIERAFGKPYTFDGSDSRDPDEIGQTDEIEPGLQYYWLCQNASWEIPADLASLASEASLSNASTFNASSFCNGSRGGVLMKAGSSIEIPYTGDLEPYSSYAIVLFVTKTVNSYFRMSTFTQVVKIVDGDPPVIKFRCKRNCRATVNPSEGLLLEAQIDTSELESGAIMEARYQWNVYEKIEQENSVVWKEFIAKDETKINQIHLLENTLQPENDYKVSVIAMVHGRTNGYSELVFSVNIPPRGGTCSVDKRSGYSDETTFSFKCLGWTDKDLPLSYEFQYRTSYGVVSQLFYGITPVFSTKLPVGDYQNNFTVDFQVKIFDSQRTYNTTRVDVQVLLGKTKQNETLSKFQNFMRESLASLIEVGKIQEATREVNAIISVLNVYALQNGTKGKEERQEMRTAIGNMITNKTMSSLSDVKQLGSALSQVTLVKEEMTLDIQRKSLKSFQHMALTVEKKSHDRDILASHINDTAVIVETGLVNVIMAASVSARVYGEPSTNDTHSSLNSTMEKARTIALEAMETLTNFTDVLSSLAVVGDEALVMSVPQMSLVLQKIRPDIEGEHVVGNGQVSVQFVNISEVLGDNVAGGNVDLQVFVFPDNPFTWDNTAATITSHVLTVMLKDEKQAVLNVSSLHNEINLFITRNVESLTQPNAAFINGENGSIAYHKFDIENVGEPNILQITPKNDSALFEIYWRSEERPQIGDDYFVAVIPDFTSCTTLEDGHETCEYDPYTVFIDASLILTPGEYYLGIASYQVSKADVNGTQSRTRRSCSEGVRRRRSCIEYKDPPPRPTNGPQGEYKIQIPEYDADRHVNYTVNSFSSPCKYWDEKNETWTSKGCRVGNKTQLERVHCLCNHLTSFGGGFITAPNPIDFDKVFEGFKNLSDNIAVLATIVTAFAIYILLAIWLRRMDKRDETIGIPTIIASGDANLNSYELTIQTGPWRGSGTTANVFIVLVGEDSESNPIALTDENKLLFTRGSTNEFLVSFPENLGKLLYLKVWHDLSGINSSWYLSYVIIRNTQTREQFIFACDRWFALEKGDGSVSRVLQVSDTKELTSFGILFRTKTSKDIFDGHLWISVVAKPSKSTFTRVQRLTCCMSLLFSAMITNAMFYNIGNTPDNSTVSVGPLTFSLKQVIIGIQSSLIALPLNIIVLQIFRNLKPKATVGSKYSRPCSRGRNAVSTSNDWSVNDVPEKKKEEASGPRLLHWFIYIAYLLCFLIVMTAAAFTLFYSMAWGKEISNKWLSSMLISFFQDAFITQPLKIFLAALIISSILKKLPSDFKESTSPLSRKTSCVEPKHEAFDPEEAIKRPSSMFEPPDESLVKKARKYKLLEMKAFTILKENIFHLLFLSSLLVISYSARDPDAFTQTSYLRKVFGTQANDIKSVWSFVENDLLPFVFDKKWYNGEEDMLDGFTDDKYLYIVGMPRLRQLRTKKGVCKGKYSKYFNLSCDGFYSILDEEKDFFLPGWVKTADLTPTACPVPWRYQTALKLDGLPYWGSKTVYSGGGYTADLGYYMEQAKGVITYLQTYNWIDKYTRAVFVELTVFNAPSNLFSTVTYLVEMTGTGGASTFVKVDTFRLYQHIGSWTALLAFCEFVAIVTVVIVFYVTCKKMFKKRRDFFRNPWNVVDVAQIVLCISAIALFFIRLMNTTWTINKVQENPFVFISFHYAIQWDEISTYVIASIVFIATLKFLQLLSFNRHIAVLGHTISRAAKGLLPLGVEALLTIFAFNMFGYVVFGSKVEGFSNIISTSETTLAMTLGKAYFMDLSHAEPVLGPVFFATFVIAIQFFLLNMFMAVIMDTYSDVNSEIDENSPEFEMAGFLLSYFKSLFGSGSEFEAGDEVWRKCRETEGKPTKKKTVKENCRVLKEQRKLLSKKIKALYKLDRDVGDSELSFAERWNTHCSSGDHTTDTEFLEMMTLYLCQESRQSFDLTICDDETAEAYA